jgi:hypothetical protein
MARTSVRSHAAISAWKSHVFKAVDPLRAMLTLFLVA